MAFPQHNSLKREKIGKLIFDFIVFSVTASLILLYVARCQDSPIGNLTLVSYSCKQFFSGEL